MIRSFLLFLSLFCSYSYATLYDSFRGTILTEAEIQSYKASNLTFRCTNNVEPCDPKEGRRIDGTCNNLDHPSRGSVNAPPLRLLPAWFGKDFEPSKAASGKDLPLARRLRTKLLSEGGVVSLKFTHLLTHFTLFIFEDIMSNQDTLNYVFERNCCVPKGKNDPQCVPNAIPEDDPVHRFSEQRCLNMTRPITFQFLGCMVGKDITPAKTSFVTPLIDLSGVYGSAKNDLQNLRTYKCGLLKYELLNGRIWPQTFSPEVAATVCLLNRRPKETRCHDFPNPIVNAFAGSNMFFIWFWRHHNQVAEKLCEMNPCWSDQKLFDTARDINIATALQIYFYETIPDFAGKENLIRDEIILSKPKGFRDIYNKTVIPQLSLEYVYALRYLHTMQEDSLRMYSKNGTYIGKVPLVDMTLRTGYIARGHNLAYLTQGSFRQGTADADDVVAPDISERGFGALQEVSDITTNDLSKGRYFGFPPYIKYREYCFGDKIKCWDDLKGIIDPQELERLRFAYESPKDIDFLAGMWLEKHIAGGDSPAVLYCIIVDQMKRNIVSDRHWYERKCRPNAFTLSQLREIRKATIASFLCEVGDSVTEIQPHAFRRIGKNNKITKCSEIKKIDYSLWKDKKCSCDKSKKDENESKLT